MAIKRVGKTPEVIKNEPTKQVDEKSIDDILASFTPAELDAVDGGDNAISIEDDDKGPAFPDPPEERPVQQTQKDMSVHSPEFYENQSGFQPAIELTDKDGHKIEAPVRKKIIIKNARPANEIDLENLDESMIMDMPEIKAASFKIIDILDPKPKDKSIRFRWANCKNYVAGNLGRYLAIGFQIASIDDVDQKRTPIDASMIDGTQIKYFDVVLIKINVIRLMELYKTNILKSINKLAKAKEKGLAEANRQFRSDIGSEAGASAAYNHYKQVLGKEPVEFYATE